MKIPKIISKNEHEYIFVKEYTNFIMYKDMITGIRECFSLQELGLIEKQEIMKGFKLRPEIVRK